MTELIADLLMVYSGFLKDLGNYYFSNLTSLKVYLIHGAISAYIFFMWLEYIPSTLRKNGAFTLADLISSPGAFFMHPIDNNEEGIYFCFLFYCFLWLPVVILVKIFFIMSLFYRLVCALKNINKNKTFLFLDKIILFKRKRR
jgi:hypothetical protein